MDESSFYKHLDAMRAATIVAVDTETTGLSVKDGRDYLMGISVSYRLGALGIMSAYFPFRHETDNLPIEWVGELKTLLESHALVFHNLKFDLHSLNTIGIVPRGKVYDTLTMAHMVNEEWPSKRLDYLGKRLINEGKMGDAVRPWAETFGWASVPAKLMAPYACQDAELTLKLFEYLWPKMQEQELHTLWPTERRFARLLVDAEQRGVKVDLDFCAYMERKGEERMQDLRDDLCFDPASPIQLGDYLLDELKLPIIKVGKPTKRYPDGRPSFDKKVMEQYEEILENMDNDAARKVLEFRGWQKAVTSLYRPLQELVSPDGRVRTNFNQHIAVTGRLSSDQPNLQQVPKRTDKPWNGEARKSFTCDDGWSLYGYDYAQLELRLAAAYGREVWLLNIFEDDEADVFTEWSNNIGVVRDTVKTYTYATLYGAGLAKIARTLGRPQEEVSDSFYAFKKSIAGVGHVSQRATQRAETRGYVKMWTGRRRHFQYRDDCHKAFNSLLQGGGAEVVKRAMISIDDDPRIDKSECRIVLQIHDEIVFEIRNECVDKYDSIIKQHMVNFPDFGVRFKTERKQWNG